MLDQKEIVLELEMAAHGLTHIKRRLIKIARKLNTARPPANKGSKAERLLSEFLQERCVESELSRLNATALFDRFSSWCKERGQVSPFPSQRRFGSMLTNQLGFEKSKSNGRVFYLGLSWNNHHYHDEATK